MAEAGATPVLLARTQEALGRTAEAIAQRTGRSVEAITCDLADAAACRDAGDRLAREHSDLDGLIHNGAMWLPGTMQETGDADIEACIASAAIGSLILTRHLLPVLRERPQADIHTVVSTSGLANLPLQGTSVAFRAAKAAQDGFVHGLADELKHTSVRVTATYPCDFEEASPSDQAWNAPRRCGDPLTGREVVEAVLFTLNLPPNAAVKTLVIERSRAGGHGAPSHETGQ